MTPAVRLLRASGTFDRRDLRTSGENAPARNRLEVEFAESDTSDTTKPWVSVVIGKNGVGKSRLLAGIAGIFEGLYRNHRTILSDNLAVDHVSYACEGKKCEINVLKGHRIETHLDGMRCDVRDLPLPRKVIALTTTPFDKFRIPRPYAATSDSEVEREINIYTYLGLRDRSGRASTTAAIFRALEGLFEASRSGTARRTRIAGVFDFLGYQPKVEVQYELSRYRVSEFENLLHRSRNSRASRDTSSYLERRVARLLDRDPNATERMRDLIKDVHARTDKRGRFKLRADFVDYTKDLEFFRQIQLLRAVDLIRMRSAEITRKSDDTTLDLKLASSGELGIVTGFLGLASSIREGSLIFVDEPEISLHPEWQTGYIDLLLKTFSGFGGCHFVLATHSPLILSDISEKNSNLVSLDPNRRDAEDSIKFSGQSADHLLITAFQVAGKNNLYLKQEIIRALRLIANGDTRSEELTSILSTFKDLLPSLESSDPVAKLIKQIFEASKSGDKSR